MLFVEYSLMYLLGGCGENYSNFYLLQSMDAFKNTLFLVKTKADGMKQQACLKI